MSLIERLRCEAMEKHSSSCIAEAAAELEANAAEIGRLREALVEIAELTESQGCNAVELRCAEIARAALNKQESGNV